MQPVQGPIEVLLADDHELVRHAIGRLLRDEPDIRVVGEAGDARAALEAVERLAPRIVLTDLSMPAGGGVALIRNLHLRRRSARCIALTGHEEDEYLRSAMAVGAWGYVSKQSPARQLPAAIRRVASGQTYIDERLLNRTIDALLTRRPAGSVEPERQLSLRERQVLDLLARGHTNQRVADELCISVKTAETYRTRLGRKLGLQRRCDFVRYGADTGRLELAGVLAPS